MSEAAQARYRVGGMDCAACATKIDTAVRRMDGVEDVAVSVTTGTMTVRHDGSSDLKAIEKKVTGLGYSVAPLKGKAPAQEPKGSHDHAHHDHDHAHEHEHEHEHHDH